MESLAYKCPNCGADIKFSAKDQKFTCEYCLSSFTQEEMKAIAASQEQQAAARPQEEIQTDADFAGQTSVYHCDSCGTSFVIFRKRVILKDQWVKKCKKHNHFYPFASL